MLKREFGSKRDEATGGWTKLRNLEVINYTVPQVAVSRHSHQSDFLRSCKSWNNIHKNTKFWHKSLKKDDSLDGLGLDETIILKNIPKK